MGSQPELEGLDAAWEEELEVQAALLEQALEGDDDPFNRVTAVPDLPQEVFAREMMAHIDANSSPPHAARAPADSLPPVLGGSGTPRDPAKLPEPLNSSLEPVAPLASPRAPSVPRSRLPTGELKLELDEHAIVGSPLELADTSSSASQLPPRRSSLELDIPSVSSSHPAPPANDESDMNHRYAMGDFTGALVIAESILESSPSHSVAERCAQSCREVLTQMYTARLGRLDQLVRVVIPTDQIRWLSLDHRAGFLLSLVDGTLSLEELLDISGMSRLDALRIMYTLHDQRVVAMSDPRS